MKPNFIILVTYSNGRTYNRFAMTKEGANKEAAHLRKQSDVRTVAVQRR